MTVLASSGLAGALPVLLVLACPLMMIFMMRGMHGGHGRGHAGHGGADGSSEEPGTGTGSRATMSLEELTRERDELDALISERSEQAVEARR